MIYHPKNRGNSLFGFLIAFAIGGLIGAAIACLAGWICGSSGGGGGGQLSTPFQCTSSPNSCGLVGTGDWVYTCPTPPAGDQYTFVDPNGTDTNAGAGSGIMAGTPTCYLQRPGSGDEPAWVYVPDSDGGFTTATPTKSCGAAVPSESLCPNPSVPSSSPPNACGQTNTGTQPPGGSCSATTPSNASCPTPVIPPDNGFIANPTVLTTTPNNPSGQTTLTWQSTNSTDCSIVGDNGFSFSGGSSGSTVATGLTTTTTFTLTCQDGPGGPTASKSLRVIVNAKVIEL